MLCPSHLRSARRPSLALWLHGLLCAGMAGLFSAAAFAQTTPATSPASIPAGASSPVPPPAATDAAPPLTAQISAKQAREADDAYIAGAKQVEHKDLAAAERSFARAVQLSPANRDYVLALVVTRENRVTELVQQAAKARLAGDNARADALLAEARTLDPENRVVLQHFGVDASPLPTKASSSALPASEISTTLAGPVELAFTPGRHSFHLQSDPQTLLRTIYTAYGITPVFDPSVNGGSVRFDVDDVGFDDAVRIVSQVTHVFGVPLQPKQVLLAKDSNEKRQELVPQIEETVYLPGYTQDQMTELATVARNIFDLKQVTASATGGFMLLRGDEASLRLVNATYADMLDGGSDVLFDVNLYEIDATKVHNIGATLPSSVGAFDLVNSAQNLINNNQSVLSQAIASGAITLTSNTGTNLIEELGFLIAAGVSGSSQFTNLLGYVGTYSSLPLVGVSLAAGTTFNFALNSTDSRLLDAVQIRSGNGQATTFRAGSRYPIETAQYSSGVSSALASQLSGLNINGTSVGALLSKYLGSTQTNIPQFQFEDLGITLKITPHVLHAGNVQVGLDLKIEALGGTSINSIPILNNRALTSTITVPTGQTAMLATLVTNNELRSIDGLPGLSELPGFQGTEQDREKDTDELVITITPHIVRPGAVHIASRRLLAVHTTPGSQ